MKPAIFTRRLAAPAAAGTLDPSLAAGEIALALWLGYAVAAYTAVRSPGWPAAIGLALASAASSWLLGLHRRPSAQPARFFFFRSLLLAPVLGVLSFVGEAWRHPSLGAGGALWTGSVLAFLFLAFHLCFWAARSAWPAQPLEIIRWLVVGGAGFVLLLPFYGRHGLGGGDAYWYVVMLADVVAQLRHGVFPVWVGQSEYAFNGAVSPLRLAPLFQYSGGLLDFLTAHRLEPTALKNAVIAAGGLATAASAYLAVRAALPRRAALACVLALLWLASPAVLATLYITDQYMQWVALPFLPLLLFGCWRLWTRNDPLARLALVVAVAGMMLGHTPTALWGGLLAAGMYLAHLLARKSRAGEGRNLAALAAGFIVLGAFPIGSALTIDNPVPMAGGGGGISAANRALFPDNFWPLDPAHLTLASFQIGYALLAVGLVSAVLLLRRRPRGGLAFIAAMLVLAVLTLPVPGLSERIWRFAPPVLVTINGQGTPQRLFEFWGLSMIFALVLAVSPSHPGRRVRCPSLVLLLLWGGGAWSAREAAKFVTGISPTFSAPDQVNVNLRPENLQLTRYAYAAFSTVPNYASQGHLDPLLENRLLERTGLQPVATNADAAAPPVPAEGDLANWPRLAQAGRWVATRGKHSRLIYELSPPLRLAAGRHYALRVDFTDPERNGVLQIIDDALFQEFLLPDSGLALSPRPMSFGSQPSSGHVVALEQQAPPSVQPFAQFVARQDSGEQFDFARFWLYTYEPANLPIRVTSWIPYRAEVETGTPAYLETPRVWQRGWRAQVNGREVDVQDSPHALAMVPVEPGTSQVVLTFHPPLWLSGWFWLCLAGWSILLGWIARWVVRRAFSPAHG